MVLAGPVQGPFCQAVDNRDVIYVLTRHAGGKKAAAVQCRTEYDAIGQQAAGSSKQRAATIKKQAAGSKQQSTDSKQ